MNTRNNASKVMTLERAVSLINDGDSIAFGGMLIYRRPVAAAIEIVKQQKKHLTLMGWTLGIEADLIVGMNLADTIRTSYFGLETFGLSPMFRKKVEAGQVKVIEETESSIGSGIRAALQGVGFMPARALLGSDILKVRPDIKIVKCPYTGEEYPAMPAWRPKVAIIHALMADNSGNSVLGANLCVDSEIAQLAEYTIVTTEKIVDTHEIPDGQAHVIGSCVDAVVEVPGGSWPTSCYPVYGLDGKAFVDYLYSTADLGFTTYLEGFIDSYSSRRAQHDS